MGSEPSDGSSTPLSRIVETVEDYGQTLSLFNVDVDRERVQRIVDYFEPTTVEVRRGRTADVRPQNFAVLHREERFVAACDVRTLSDALDLEGQLVQADRPSADLPELLSAVDRSVFTDYGKRRMIIASRQVEKRAWRDRPATLHVGFQEFRRLRTQRALYERLADDVTVHLYGVPDWEPTIDGLGLHGYDDPELRDHWFVVYAPSGDAGDRSPRVLLAEERGDNVYYGFWTEEPAVAERVLDRLRSAFPANDPFE